jgi:hypothetical protein
MSPTTLKQKLVANVRLPASSMQLRVHPPCEALKPSPEFREWLASRQLRVHPPCEALKPSPEFREWLASRQLRVHPPCEALKLESRVESALLFKEI